MTISVIDKKELTKKVLKELSKTNCIDKDDLKWCLLILSRKEPQQDGFVQLQPVINAAYEYNSKPSINEYDDYLRQLHIAKALTVVKNFYYRQPRVLIACPQRQQHLPNGSAPPNITGIIAPQPIRAEADQCFGLDHVESRNYFVKKAIKSNIYSHILFVDEDQLLPLNCIMYLLNLNLESVGLNYVKKNPMLESIATEIVADSRDVWRNQSVSAEDPNDLTPRMVNCLGLGALMVDVEVFRKVPEPWFAFQTEKLPDGSNGRLMLGEDSHFCRAMMLKGINTYIIPGMVAPHCDFKTGEMYGPTWLIDPVTRKFRDGMAQHYTHFSVDPKSLYVEYDNSDILGRGKKS